MVFLNFNFRGADVVWLFLFLIFLVLIAYRISILYDLEKLDDFEMSVECFKYSVKRIKK
jgi:hypothetical protein